MLSAPDVDAREAEEVRHDGVPLESVLCTDELSRRPTRSPNYESENRALVALAQALADAPENILQTLADTILSTLNAESAGISLVTEDGKRFHWPAISGAWKPHIGGGTPRDFGPCGDVLDRNVPLMFSHLQRRYTYFQPVQPQVEEAILVPFHIGGKAVGTVWAVTHTVSRRFDAEDMRQLQSLGRFASAAYQAVLSMNDLEQEAKALRDSERQFREMIDALPAAIYTTDAQGRLTHFNPACVEFSGRAPQLGSDHWCVTWKLYYPDGTPMPHDACPMAIALKEGRVIRGSEAIAERPDGTRVWFEPYPTTLRDAAGNIIGGINMLVDITARKRAEQALRENEERFRTMADNISQLAWTCDKLGDVTWYNHRWLDYTGLSFEEMKDWGWERCHHPDHLNRVVAGVQRSRESGEPWDDTFPLRGKDGEYRWFLSRAVPIRDTAGTIVRWFGTNTDITEQLEVERRLREANQEAEAANRAKDMFLKVLSHELRTPLAPVFMTLTALELKADLPQEMREDVTMMRRNVELEVKLIDDLLDISRITTGKLRLQFDRLDINEIIRHVCETCRSNMLEKGVHLHCDVETNVDPVVGDPARLQQVFWNLLNNATKFTPEGGDIYISVRGADDEGQGRRVRVTVRDTGLGIAPEVLPRIFDAFEQGDLNITRQFGGIGLGLAISKVLVERHRGSIRAESEGRNKGATFVVELPTMSRDEPVSAPSQSQPNSGASAVPLRLLVVEDHADTAVILGRLLKASGHVVKTATTAAAALALAGETRFDIVISDLGLPDMTGYELMKQLKARYDLKGIAMSGYGMEEDIRRGEEAGFSAHLVKPLDIARLDISIRHVAGKG